jgi:hypothetical protein
MYVCVRVYVYVYVYVYVHAVCARTRACTRMYVCMYVYVFMGMCYKQMRTLVHVMGMAQSSWASSCAYAWHIV